MSAIGAMLRGLRSGVSHGEDLTRAVIRQDAEARGVVNARRMAQADPSLFERATQLRDELVAPAREARQKQSRLDELLEKFDADRPAQEASADVLRRAGEGIQAGTLSKPEFELAQKLASAGPLRRALAALKSHEPVTGAQAARPKSGSERIPMGTPEVFKSGREVESEASAQIRAALLSGSSSWMKRARHELLRPDAQGRPRSHSMASVTSAQEFEKALQLTRDERAILDAKFDDPAQRPGQEARAATTALAGGGLTFLATRELAKMRSEVEDKPANDNRQAEGPGASALAPLAQEIGGPQAEALMQLAQLAEFAKKDRRVQLEYDGALAAVGEIAPRRALAQAVRAAQQGGRVEVTDELIVAADRLIEHFGRRPAPPVDTGGDDEEITLPVAAPRPEQGRDGAGAQTGGDGERRPQDEGGERAPLLEQKNVSVRQFQRRFNQIVGRLRAQRIAADNVRGPQTEDAITTVFDAVGEQKPSDPGEALQRAHEIVQGWYTGDVSLKRLQELLIAALGGDALPEFGADGKWGEETEAAVVRLLARAGVTDIDPSDGLTVSERNDIYYRVGLGNDQWAEQKRR